MKETTFAEHVHAELIELLAGEGEELGRGSPDTQALATRLAQLAEKDQLDPFALVELEHRARLICSIAGVAVKGRAVRVARLVEVFARALAAAKRAVGDGGA